MAGDDDRVISVPVSLFGSFFARVIARLPEEEQERALAAGFDVLDELGSEPLEFTPAELKELRQTIRQLRSE